MFGIQMLRDLFTRVESLEIISDLRNSADDEMCYDLTSLSRRVLKLEQAHEEAKSLAAAQETETEDYLTEENFLVFAKDLEQHLSNFDRRTGANLELLLKLAKVNASASVAIEDRFIGIYSALEGYGAQVAGVQRQIDVLGKLITKLADEAEEEVPDFRQEQTEEIEEDDYPWRDDVKETKAQFNVPRFPYEEGNPF